MAKEKDLTELLHEDCHGEKGKTYQISHEGETHSVKLIEIKELGPGEEGRRAPYSLIFEARGAKLEQGVYTVEHGNLGTGDLLLVPLHPDEMGLDEEEAEIYEAVFA